MIKEEWQVVTNKRGKKAKAQKQEKVRTAEEIMKEAWKRAEANHHKGKRWR